MNYLTKLLILCITMINYSSIVYAAGNEETSIIKTILQLIFYIIIFVFVIFFSLYGTKLIAKNFKGITSSKYIKLLDIINIPGGAKIIIAKINRKIYILSTNNNGINVIDVIEEEEFYAEEESFDNYLSKYLNTDYSNYNISNKIKSLINKFNIKKDKDDNRNEKKY